MEKRINRFAVLADFKMKNRLLIGSQPHLRNLLPHPYIITFTHQDSTVAAIRTQKMHIVFHDDQITVPDQSLAAIDDLSCRRRPYRFSVLAGDIQTLPT